MDDDIRLEYGPAKNARNIRDRGLSFEWAREFEWATAHIEEDVRKLYPERRYIATGWLTGRVHVLCFTPVTGGYRIISFRKANEREVARHEAETTDE